MHSDSLNDDLNMQQEEYLQVLPATCFGASILFSLNSFESFSTFQFSYLFASCNTPSAAPRFLN